jgi:hypothetical protein
MPEDGDRRRAWEGELRKISGVNRNKIRTLIRR